MTEPQAPNRAQLCFNPRPRVEGDIRLPTESSILSVSIRALAWRAIPYLERPESVSQGFNPRPRVEGDGPLPESLKQ